MRYVEIWSKRGASAEEGGGRTSMKKKERNRGDGIDWLRANRLGSGCVGHT